MIYAVGVDITQNDRVKEAVGKWGERFVNRVFTEGERRYCFSKSSPIGSLAGRFAAKEAFIKACGKATAFRDIEVVSDTGGKPSLRLHGDAEGCMRALGITASHLSISHERHYSVAVVILEV
ncbi:holo-ACP synthase [Candidatus Magnetobacterium casense]|uniref:holo-ACP synthase n=1 Tax=Candidatus Magnetobacterium casense TaxID=1455061 RepID=UPI000697191B|nr:holo-ACP synthase [Candidatus Magnetobacterium casensis]